MNFLESNRRQFNRWAKVYDSFFFRLYFEPLYRRLMEIIQAQSGKALRKGGAMLDVACGTGELLLRAAKRYPKGKFYGIDISEKMIQTAIAKTEGMGNISLQVGKAARLPFAAEVFDVALCSEAFHHFDKPAKTLREIHRVIKTKGVFILMDPGQETWMERFVFGWGGRFEHAHKVYSKDETFALLADAGFTIREYTHWRFNNFFISIKRA